MNKEFWSWVLNQSPAIAVLIAIAVHSEQRNERLILENQKLTAQIIEIYKHQNSEMMATLQEIKENQQHVISSKKSK